MLLLILMSRSPASFIANLAFIASSQGIYYSSIAVSHHFRLDQRALRCSADLISFV